MQGALQTTGTVIYWFSILQGFHCIKHTSPFWPLNFIPMFFGGGLQVLKVSSVLVMLLPVGHSTVVMALPTSVIVYVASGWSVCFGMNSAFCVLESKVARP